MKSKFIQKKTKYIFNGEEYDSITQIKEKIETIIGEKFIDKILKECPSLKVADSLKILDIILSPDTREVLIKHLDIKLELADGVTINILDYSES